MWTFSSGGEAGVDALVKAGVLICENEEEDVDAGDRCDDEALTEFHS